MANFMNRPDHEPTRKDGVIVPGIGHYEDLLAFQWRAIQEQQRTIEMLTGVIQRITKLDDAVVEAEVSF